MSQEQTAEGGNGCNELPVRLGPLPPEFPREKYLAAIEEEGQCRDFAFLGLNHEILGVPLVPMTLRQLIALLAMNSPFLVGTPISEGDVAAFLWFLNPDFKRPGTRGAAVKRQAFVKRIARLPYRDVVKGIHDYLDTTFMDSPPSSGSAGKPPIASVAAWLIDVFGSEYGWSRDTVLDSPMAQLYQSLREIKVRHNPKTIPFNRKSDKIHALHVVALQEWKKRQADTAPSLP